jgi:hypothetical protein
MREALASSNGGSSHHTGGYASVWVRVLPRTQQQRVYWLIGAGLLAGYILGTVRALVLVIDL